jgi:hypothetical protein
MRVAMLGMRFLLEVSLLVALGYWGFRLGSGWPVRVLAGIGAPVGAAAVWGRYVAPKASRRVEDPGRFAIELGFFGLGAAALVAVGAPWVGAGLFVVYVLNGWSLGPDTD